MEKAGDDKREKGSSCGAKSRRKKCDFDKILNFVASVPTLLGRSAPNLACKTAYISVTVTVRSLIEQSCVFSVYVAE